MTHNTLAAALVMAAMGLSACSEHDAMINGKICANFKTVPAGSASAATIADAASPVDDCLRRWAYSLAGARDPADAVADATVAACGSALSRWNQAGLNQQQSQSDAAGPVEALSLTTGQPTNPMAEHNAFAHGRAMLYVVQARAGRCAPPPATNGAPTGV